MKIVGKRMSVLGAWAAISWLRCGISRNMRMEVKGSTMFLQPATIAVVADVTFSSASKAKQ